MYISEMKKNFLKLIYLIYMMIILFSCVPPSKDMAEINILEWLNELLNKFNEINLNKEKQKVFIEDEIRGKKILLIFKKEYKIYLNTIKKNESDFIYSIDDNSFILKRPIYLTSENNEIYINTDINKNQWFKFDLFGTESNIENDYNFISQLNEKNNRMQINLTSALRIKKKLNNIITLKNKKEVVKLNANMAFTDDNNKDTSPVDLNKKILYIPGETIFTINIDITGNIINTTKNENGINITALKDIFIYINKKMLNISFNKEKWDLTLSAIDFTPKLTIKSINEKKINFHLDIKLLHKE